MPDAPRIVKPYPDNDEAPSSKTWHYSVTWAPSSNETEDHLQRVQVIEGYSTFSDIQRIIGVSRGLTRDQVIIKNVRLSDVTSDPR